jgi:carboxymethylenebutenolidase
MEIIEEVTSYQTLDGASITTFVARPDDADQHPGIVLIHEIWGLNEQIRGVARRYAKEGYVVVAPHLFSRHEELTEDAIRNAMGPVFSIPQEKRRDPDAMAEVMESMDEASRAVVQILFVDREALMEGMAQDVPGAYDFIKSMDCVIGDKIGVTGFCMGGGLAFQVATALPFAAAFIFYGQAPTPIESVANLSGPVFVVYAGEDMMLNNGIPALIHTMLENKKTYGLKIYANMQHGFFNEYGRMYDQASADDAWQLAIAHFDRYLKA